MKTPTTALALDSKTRNSLWNTVLATIESYWQSIEGLPVSPSLDVEGTRCIAESFTFDRPLQADAAFRIIASELIKGQVHTPHPQYFGLFNPAPTAISAAADALVATLNPQLAAWSHSPLAVEMERHLVRVIAEKFGCRVIRLTASSPAEALRPIRPRCWQQSRIAGQTCPQADYGV
jgi:hypothetical protein